MDRFEAVTGFVAHVGIVNLHSSMDRFEGADCLNYFTENVIYIPVWIDLKSFKPAQVDEKILFTFQYG